MEYATRDNNFQKLFPHLAKQWHPTKNGGLIPRKVAPYSRKKIWWICDRGHEYQARVYSRSRGTGCRFCSGRKRIPGISDWKSGKRTLGLSMSFKKLGRTSSGKILVEMSQEAWENLALLTLPMKDLGTAVFNYRKTHGLSQKEFGERIGCARNSIVSVENGHYYVFSTRTIRRIVSALME